jgi:hypothetical protein
VLDEVRVSNAARSADWLKFEYHNLQQTDCLGPTTFTCTGVSADMV